MSLPNNLWMNNHIRLVYGGTFDIKFYKELYEGLEKEGNEPAGSEHFYDSINLVNIAEYGFSKSEDCPDPTKLMSILARTPSFNSLVGRCTLFEQKNFKLNILLDEEFH